MHIGKINGIALGVCLCFVAGVLALTSEVFAEDQPDGRLSFLSNPKLLKKKLVVINSGSMTAQTSEVTILLEKKMPLMKPVGNLPLAEKPANKPPANNPEAKAGEQTQEVGQTASSALGSQGMEFYREMEDPFATPGEKLEELQDPFEGYNRFMYNFNEGIYDYFMEPVARGYRKVVHEEIRIAIKNLFDNALAPVKFVSSLLQGDLDKSGRVLSRTVINTTMGIGGLFDVAGSKFNIDNVNEDMDQAFGAHNVPTGPYIVLPLFGPSTARNVVGRITDSFLNPLFLASAPIGIGVGITFEETLNDTSFILDDKEALEESAVDEYESVRDFYHQYREGLVKE